MKTLPLFPGRMPVTYSRKKEPRAPETGAYSTLDSLVKARRTLHAARIALRFEDQGTDQEWRAIVASALEALDAIEHLHAFMKRHGPLSLGCSCYLEAV